jgi:hypothetical protein
MLRRMFGMMAGLCIMVGVPSTVFFGGILLTGSFVLPIVCAVIVALGMARVLEEFDN